MTITHETTVEQYEAWLATNPSMTDMKVFWRKLVKGTFKIISRVKRAVKKHKRSLLSAAYKTTVPDNRHYGNHDDWKTSIFRARVIMTRHNARHEMFDTIAENKWAATVYAQRHERLAARIDEELVMEELFEEALTLLTR